MDGNIGQKNRETLNAQGASGASNNFESFNTPEMPVNSQEAGSFEAGKETEQAITQGEQQPTIGTATQPIPMITPQVPVGATGISHTVPNPNSATPLTAGHSDKIEKQWIEAGNNIIENTKHDPHQQKIQIDDLKDKYQTTRYGSGED